MSKQENGRHPAAGQIITGDTLEHAQGGFTRRDMMRTLLAGSLVTVGGTGLLTASGTEPWATRALLPSSNTALTLEVPISIPRYT